MTDDPRTAEWWELMPPEYAGFMLTLRDKLALEAENRRLRDAATEAEAAIRAEVAAVWAQFAHHTWTGQSLEAHAQLQAAADRLRAALAATEEPDG